MTPEDLYWQDELEAMTRETISFYDAKYQQEAELIHPILAVTHPDERKYMAHRINAAWSRVSEFIGWKQFVDITNLYLEAELLGTMEISNLTDNVMAYVHFSLEDYGIEVAKIRNGMRIKAQSAVREIRDKVINMAIKENLLAMADKEDIKLKIYLTIAN